MPDHTVRLHRGKSQPDHSRRLRLLKRLGCLVIGDEILAGHVHESNSHWLARRCKQLGIDLRRVEVGTDELSDIEASVRRFLYDLELDYVVTSGGLGPTPDDRTMEGIARALGVPLASTPEWVAWMEERVGEGHRRGYFDSPLPNAGIRKMVLLPEGAEAMPNRVGTALGAIVTADNPRRTRLFTLPGVPREFERMFDESVVPHLERSEPLWTEELVLYTEESRFYETLLQLDEAFPDVMLGSYPHEGSITIRATGPRQKAQALIARMREAGREYLRPREHPRSTSEA